jgi:phosphoribosylformimino-5-aminoimidazole carboxamide ribotide isomerase
VRLGTARVGGGGGGGGVRRGLGMRASTIVAVNASASRARAVRFRPCIDIHDGKVKQIVGSTLKDARPGDAGSETPATNFETETPSSAFAEMYKRDGIYGGHAILLSKDEATRRVAKEAVRAFPGGLQVGGGVTPTNASELLDAGASHVIVTSYVFRDGALNENALNEMVRAVGADKLVLDLSCRLDDDGRYKVVTDRWQKWTDLAVDGSTMERLAECCDEFLVHGVDVEGMKLGIDLKLVQLLGEFCPIPVTYAGGARSLDDLELVKAAGRGMVDITVGSALDCFGGALKYDDVVAWHNQQKLEVK